MEITSFVLGMLTIVAVLIVTAIVVGMVKINQLKNKTENLTQLCAAIESDLRQEINHTNDSVWRQFESTGRDITMVERTIMNQIDETRRYTDSRIDKVVAKGTIEGSKQVIKG
jgi:predicted Holliday junction resolvase-like endonuclease